MTTLLHTSNNNNNHSTSSENSYDSGSVNETISSLNPITHISTPQQLDNTNVGEIDQFLPDEDVFDRLSELTRLRFDSVISLDGTDTTQTGVSPLLHQIDTFQSNMNIILNDNKLDSFESIITSTQAMNKLPSSQYFPVELHPTDDICNYYSKSIDNIINTIHPTEEQSKHHTSTLALLRKQIRITLGASIYSIGLQDINCSLVDDPISIAAIIPKPLVTNWHVNLIDRLHHMINERMQQIHSQDMDITAASRFNDEEELLLGRFIISFTCECIIRNIY